MPIRPAEARDLPRILAITNDAILHSTSNWNVRPTTLCGTPSGSRSRSSSAASAESTRTGACGSG